jgi:hypothetical protein
VVARQDALEHQDPAADVAIGPYGVLALIALAHQALEEHEGQHRDDQEDREDDRRVHAEQGEDEGHHCSHGEGEHEEPGSEEFTDPEDGGHAQPYPAPPLRFHAKPPFVRRQAKSRR